METTVTALHYSGAAFALVILFLYLRHSVKVRELAVYMVLGLSCYVGASVLEDMYGEKPVRAEGDTE